jgi:hypothetical protein
VPAGAASYHPAQAVLRDGLKQVREPLRQLYPSVEEQLDSSVTIMSTSGRGGSVQVPLLGPQLIRCAALRAGWPDRHDEDAFFEQLDATLDQLRRLARRRSVDVPARVGLGGVTLPHGHRLQTELGTLTAAPSEDALWPGMPVPDVVLTSRFPVRYTRTTAEQAAGPTDEFWTAWRTFESRVDKLRLAVLLATWPQGPVTLRLVSTEIFDPLFAGTRQSRFVPQLPRAELSRSAEQDIRTWAQRIAEHFDQRIAQAIRRTLSAADQLREPDDALVDAVIALESLFGTGKSEVGFRLQLAIAFLLGDTDEQRNRIFEQVGELYAARSALVHGESASSPRVNALRQDAVELAVRCFRLLFTSHHQLITTDARGKAIILGGSEQTPI